MAAPDGHGATEPVTDGHGTTVALPVDLFHDLHALSGVVNTHTCAHKACLLTWPAPKAPALTRHDSAPGGPPSLTTPTAHDCGSTCRWARQTLMFRRC